jgi:hypothetical protein
MSRRNPKKSWKDRRKTQYRLAGIRSEENKHVTVLDDWLDAYHLEKHFEEHDIPYRVEKVSETYTRWSELRRVWYTFSLVVAHRFTWWQ